MSQSYKKSCIYCNKTIEMSDNASGKWLPYNIDGTQHDCRKETQTNTGTQKKIVDKPLSIEERLVRLERIVLDPRK